MNDNIRRIKQIETENKIWIIYFFIIGLCLYGNKFEKQYFMYNDLAAKDKYRKISIFVFVIAIIIYIYFFLDNYKDVKNLDVFDSNRKKNLNKLSLLGSTFVLLSGLIFLYIAIVDTEIDVEIAFN